MAAQARPTLFKPDELADEADVEALETAAPAPEEQPTGLSAEEQAPVEQPPAEKHEEAIPYEKWKLTNEANQRLEAELAQHREFRTRLDERQKLIREHTEAAQRAEAAQKQAAQRPDPGLDPVGAELFDARSQIGQQQLAIQQLNDQLNQLNQNYQSGQEQAAFAGWVTNEANSYSQQVDPHYFTAAKHVSDNMTNFWRAITPNAPAGLAEKLTEGQAILIARLSQQYGGKFPAAISALAKSWGFNAQPNGNGQAQRAPQSQSPQAQRLQQVKQGQQVRSLSNVPAAPATNGASKYREYSAVDIAQMPEKEFMAAMADPKKAADLQFAMSRADGIESDEVRY